ncbi:MAG: ATP-dependent acyl-CoA ligase [Steroidobacteraceae bacterium]
MDYGWKEARPQTLTGILEQRTQADPDRIALTMQGQNISYSDLVARANAHARGLLQLGVRKGDVVAMLCENCVGQVYTEFATARIGAIEVMLNTGLKGSFLSHQLRDSGAKLIIVERALLPNVLAILNEVPSLESIVLLDNAPYRGETPSRAMPILPLKAVDGHAESDLIGVEAPQWTDTCSIVYTSGTTGLSKGVQLSNNYICLFAELESRIWYRDKEDVFYSTGPLFHLAGKGIGVLGSIYRGVRCVQEDRFSASVFWRRVREEKATATVMLGSIAMLLWGRERSEEEGIRTVVGIPIPADLHRPMEKRWGCTFESAYGLSECAPVVCTGPESPMKPGSAGRVCSDYFDVRIFDENDRELAAGQVGEVVVRQLRPYSMLDAYWQNPEATRKAMRNQWFHTGDLGRFDSEGYFYFVDRGKDYMRRRGENISSFEVESALARHPAVVDSAVVSAASEVGEDEVKAFITLRPGITIEFPELVAFCVEHMPYFAVPRYFKILDELPRTPSGKVQKGPLRERSNSECWDRERDGGIVLSGKRARSTSLAAAVDPGAAPNPSKGG